MNVTLNDAQRLFVITTPFGVSCCGFEHIAQQLAALLDRVPEVSHLRDAAAKTAVGTLDQYRVYSEAIDVLLKLKIQTPTWFDPGTPIQVQRIIERYRTRGGTLRIYLGDPETGRDWLDENDVIGRVGRSMGPLRVPLLIDRGDTGGGAIMDRHIVRLQDVSSGRVLWSHPTYHQPELRIVDAKSKGFRFAVTADGSVHARFREYGSAVAFVAFLSGTLVNQTPTQELAA